MKRITKIICAVLAGVLSLSLLVACNGNSTGGNGSSVNLDKGYTYSKQNTDGLMQFYSSDSSLDAFLNEYMERHLRYSDKAIGDMKLGQTSTAWKEWEAMSTMWMNTGAIGYSPKENLKNFLTSIYQDDFGYIWIDNGTNETDWGQSWQFPSASHSSGKNHTYFNSKSAAAMTKSWKAYTDKGTGFGLVADTRQRTVVGRQHHLGQLFVVGEQGKQLAVAQGLHAPRRHFIEDILHKSRK